MRIAISNIAWDVAKDDDVADLLRRYLIDAVDIAHGKYFPDAAAADDKAIRRVRDWWAGHGIEITGMQALLYGTTGLNLFDCAGRADAMLSHLGHVCRIAAGLGATRLVFGSPRNRDRHGLSDAQADVVATDFFYRLGEIATQYNVSICLEPNPPCYGCNFMTTADETARMVHMVAHSSIKMQFDTGAVTIAEENPYEIIDQYADIIGHVHISEPGLVPLGDGLTNHPAMAAALSARFSSSLVSIEMRESPKAPLQAIERAVQLAIQCYRLPCKPEGRQL